MTQRDLPISEPTTTEPPTISEPVTTIGEWANGLSDHITDDEKHRLMLMFGLTVDPDVLSVNGRRHVLDTINNCACGHPESFHAPHLGCSGSHHDSVPCMNYAPVDPDVLSVNGRQHVLEQLDNEA